MPSLVALVDCTILSTIKKIAHTAILDCIHVGSATTSFGHGNETADALVEKKLEPSSINNPLISFI